MHVVEVQDVYLSTNFEGDKDKQVELVKLVAFKGDKNA